MTTANAGGAVLGFDKVSVPLLPVNVLALKPAYRARIPVSLRIVPTRCQVDEAFVRAATDTTAGTGRATGVLKSTTT